MIKKTLLLFCVCLVVGLLAFHLLKPAAGPPVTLANSTDPTAFNSANPTTVVAANTPPTPVAEPVLAQTRQDSNVLLENEPAIANVPAETNVSVQDEKGTAEKEKHRLLGELRELAAKNPEGALAEVMKLPEGSERNEALEEVCFGIAQTHPADAVKLAENMHLDESSGVFIERLVQQWAASDSSAAIDWVNSQPAGGQRDGLTTRIAYSMSQADPIGAANLVITQISPGSAQNEAVMVVLNQWANQNLVAARAWAEGFPDGPLRVRAFNELDLIANQQQAMASH